MINPTDEGQDANFPKESIWTALFEEVDGGKTKLTTIYPLPEDEKQREAILKSGMREGWESSINKLEKALKE
jgi:uncharacterized protein YndB with AHSA1/START domain